MIGALYRHRFAYALAGIIAWQLPDSSPAACYIIKSSGLSGPATFRTFATGHAHRRQPTLIESTFQAYQRTDATDEESTTDVYTSILLQISFDGSRFTGWSAANTLEYGLTNDGATMAIAAERDARYRGRSTRRRKALPTKGFVRSVEGVFRTNLAQLYGKVSPERIVVEGCSRTDRGVHARCMIAQVYCLAEEVMDMVVQGKVETSIPGKRLPHPRNATDTSYFSPVPLSLSRLTTSLNRMCPDAQVMAFAPTPSQGSKPYPFHPTLSAKSKTYQYLISTGPFHDPTLWRRVWHVGAQLDLLEMRKACQILRGRHNFSAFQGAPRGQDDKDKRWKQSAVCTMDRIEIETASLWLNTTTYIVSVTGDRFLYKMVRFLVGALVGVGMGRIRSSALENALITVDRRNITFECAPAYGLVLHNVQLNEVIEWQMASC